MDSEINKKNFGYAELEKRYGIKLGTAYSLVNQKRIPHIRLGRRFILFNSKSIEDWLKIHEIEPLKKTNK